MNINWVAFLATIAASTIVLIIGIAINRFIERKPKLIYYLGHVSSFKMKEPPEAMVFTHSIVVVNYGRRSAKEVRIGHQLFPPCFNIYPPIEYEVTNLPDGAKEIVIPTLVPREQITISYLYFMPVTWNLINISVKHADGFAKRLTFLPMRQYPKWVLIIIGLFVWLGIIAFIYIIYELIRLALSTG